MATDNGTAEVAGSVYNQEFMPYIIKWGRATSWLGVLLSFGPCIGLALMGIFPPWDAFAAGMAIQFPLTARLYFQNLITYFGILGVPGSYMALLSGNIFNLRVPATSAAQSAAGVAGGTDEGTIIATVGVAVSIIVNIAILTVGVMLGAYTLSLLPAKVNAALNLLLPALFSGLTVSYVIQSPKLAPIGLPLALACVLMSKYKLLAFLPTALSASLPNLIAVFGTMGIGIWGAKKGIF